LQNINKLKLLAFAGSLREKSINKKLLKIVVDGINTVDADVIVLDINAFNLPMYNQDIEDKSFPEDILTFKTMFNECDGILIASPEYNGSYSAALKNLLDWVSRPDNTKRSYFKNKTAAIMSASPSKLGGIRGLMELRTLLSKLGYLVIPDQLGISSADSVFNENDDILDSKTKDGVIQIGRELVRITKLINSKD